MIGRARVGLGILDEPAPGARVMVPLLRCECASVILR
jgi:hypothetical protein